MATEKITKIVRKGDWEFINRVIKNSYKPWACVIELLDNAVDAVRALTKTKKRTIDITYSKKNDKVLFSIHDNGVGMTPKIMREVLSNYIAHFQMKQNGISTVGIGLPCSLLGLSDMEKGTKIAIESTTEDGTTTHAILFVSKDRANFEDFDMHVIEGDKNKKRGTTISIVGGVDMTQYSRQIKGYIEKIHPYTTSIVDITINGTKIDYSDKDKLGFKNFPEPIEDIQCGFYNIGGRIYYVKDWTLIDSLDHTSKTKVKVLYSYQPCTISLAREIKKTDGGAFAILGGRLLVCGGNFGIKKWTSFNDRGGIGRASSCVIITDETKEIFEVSGNKVNGMTPYGENNNLNCTDKYYVIDEDEKIVPFFKAHGGFEKKFSDMYSFETDGKKGEENRKITDEIAKKIIEGESWKELSEKYDEEVLKLSGATETNQAEEEQTDDFKEACKGEEEPNFEVTTFFTSKNNEIVEVKDYRNIVNEKVVSTICNVFSDIVLDKKTLAHALDIFVRKMSE